jgi:hypothetical protein
MRGSMNVKIKNEVTFCHTNNLNKNISCGFKKTLTLWVSIQNLIKSHCNVLLYWLCVVYLTNTF